jgi:hypothetical protein
VGDPPGIAGTGAHQECERSNSNVERLIGRTRTRMAPRVSPRGRVPSVLQTVAHEPVAATGPLRLHPTDRSSRFAVIGPWNAAQGNLFGLVPGLSAPGHPKATQTVMFRGWERSVFRILPPFSSDLGPESFSPEAEDDKSRGGRSRHTRLIFKQAARTVVEAFTLPEKSC